MELTKNLQLKKPAENDFYNVADFNENAEILDTEVQALKDEKLDKTGGTVSGRVKFSTAKAISHTTDNSGIYVLGGTEEANGAGVVAFGKSHGTNAGQIHLWAGDGTTEKRLRLYPDGKFTLDGKDIITSAGGTFTGGLVFPSGRFNSTYNDTYKETWISGAQNFDDGATISLEHKDSPNGNGGYFILNAKDGTNNTKLVGAPTGSLTWADKNIVRSVNGTVANASGNVTLTVPDGTVSQKHSTSKTTVSANGNKTITISGLTPYKPVYFMAWQDPSSSSDYGQTLAVSIASGLVNIVDNYKAKGDGSLNNSQAGFYFGTWVKSSNTGSLAVNSVIPTGTSLALKFSNTYSKTVTFSVKAWQ